MSYTNPIIPGFHPDPSICRVGEDYYLVTSTFEYFPGLPIFHSRDLVNWKQLGHVLDRPSQLDLDGIQPSHGLFAPTIRYHDDTYYVINTLVPNGEQDDTKTLNFIVTTTDPAGDWSEPYLLKDAPGIDPSLLFDDDSRVWYCGNRVPLSGERYNGHREIWLQELDLKTMQFTGEKYSLWDGADKHAFYAEAPHIYKINGMYYLMIAEGGTDNYHAVTMARSQHITGPYEPCGRNPILTHRNKGIRTSIAATGHADLVETQDGNWWMLALAVRPYGGDYHYNLGRETFLVPLGWDDDGWPLVNPGQGDIQLSHPMPRLSPHPWPITDNRDDFDQESLDPVWNFLRTPRTEFWSLIEHTGFLRLYLRPEKVSEWVNPSWVGRRQQHINFEVQALMEFSPKADTETAGLVIMQNSHFHFRLELTQQNSKRVIRFTRCVKGKESIIAETTVVNTPSIYLKVNAQGQDYAFAVATSPDEWQTIAENVDSRPVLSTPAAGGFVGTYIGMYASSNGEQSNNYADFDWFEYRGS